MEEKEFSEHNQQEIEKTSKLFKIAKVSILVSLSIFWIVSAILGLISLWKGEGILDTPWVIFSLVLTVVVIFFVIIPLFRSLKSDIKEYNKEKTEKEKRDKLLNEIEDEIIKN